MNCQLSTVDLCIEFCKNYCQLSTGDLWYFTFQDYCQLSTCRPFTSQHENCQLSTCRPPKLGSLFCKDYCQLSTVDLSRVNMRIVNCRPLVFNLVWLLPTVDRRPFTCHIIRYNFVLFRLWYIYHRTCFYMILYDLFSAYEFWFCVWKYYRNYLSVYYCWTSTTWWVSLLVDQWVPEGTCSQVIRSTSVDS